MEFLKWGSVLCWDWNLVKKRERRDWWKFGGICGVLIGLMSISINKYILMYIYINVHIDINVYIIYYTSLYIEITKIIKYKKIQKNK